MQKQSCTLTISIVPGEALFTEHYDYRDDICSLVQAFREETGTPQAVVVTQDFSVGIVTLLLPGQSELTDSQKQWPFAHSIITGYEYSPS